MYSPQREKCGKTRCCVHQQEVEVPGVFVTSETRLPNDSSPGSCFEQTLGNRCTDF